MFELLKRLRGWVNPNGAFAVAARHSKLRGFYTDPRAARHWHNPADPVQAARIALAQLRRDARADYRVYCAARSRNNNHAHIVQHRVPGDDYVVYKFPDRFNPFHVAH